MQVGSVFELEILEEQQGSVVLLLSGKKLESFIKNEVGGHRWQRIPPTEKNGKVQTSTITVAAFEILEEKNFQIDEKDLEWKTCRGSGAGGQHRNVTDSAVILTHKSTKISVRCESERSQKQNKEIALMILSTKLKTQQKVEKENNTNKNRRNQIGSGQRGDKRRTIALQRDQVIDHESNKQLSSKEYLKGNIKQLWI